VYPERANGANTCPGCASDILPCGSPSVEINGNWSDLLFPNDNGGVKNTISLLNTLKFKWKGSKIGEVHEKLVNCFIYWL